jgi:cytosine/adenosine deaminase-related metal-dependent hydrolase
VDGRWERGVEVEFEAGIVTRVSRGVAGGRGRVLLPGLVNAHTHLELTALRGKVGRASFPEWARRLMTLRGRWTPAEIERSAREGVRRSLAAGTTAVGDFAWLAGDGALRRSPLRGVSWREALGIAPERAAEAARRAERFLRPRTDRWTPGLAPHAPYSCSGELYRRLFAAARRARVPFATHLSELREEIRFLLDGGGPFRKMMRALGRDSGGWRPPGTRPVASLVSLGVLRGATVAHANYLTASDVAALRRARATVVWCPRTHRFFGHPPHPVRRLLRAGIPVALGTDSLASSPSLSVREEIVEAHRASRLPLGTLLKMATEYGARALGLRRVGRLARGWAADFVLVRGTSPEEALTGRILETRVAGRVAFP